MRKSSHTFRKYKFSLKSFLTAVVLLVASALAQGAIALRGTATSATTNNNTLTIAKPSGLIAGDVMIAQIVQSGNNNVSSIGNASGSGWTQIAGSSIRSSNKNYSQATLLYKITNSIDVAATNFSFTLDANSDDGEGAIVAFSGVDVNSIFDVAPSSTYTNIDNDNTLNATAITTATANSAVIMFGAISDNFSLSNWSTTNPGTLSELYDLPFDANIDIGMGAAWAIKSTIGSTGTGMATLSNTAYNGSILIALKPLPSVSFTTSSQSSSAETGTMIITVQLSSASSSTVTVPFTVTGTATNGTDYSISANTMTIPAGSTTGTATITITPDNIYEGNETVILTMGTPTNAIPGATTVHTATIADDDPAPDSDGDRVPDYLDLDDDNDGITDCAEKGLDALTVGNAFLISGNATTVSANEIQLTPNLGTQIGTAMYSNKIDFSSSFNFSFEAYLGNSDAGADGIAIIFHNDSRGASAIGASGEGMGASGIQNGIALEMDTYQNTNQGDPVADHGCIWATANIANRLTTPISLSNLENGFWHTVNVNWVASSNTISYTVDGATAGQYTGDLITNFFAGSSSVYFGFSAATGGSINFQSVRFSNLCDLPAIVDNDHDGIPDNLDLDSDGDGCFDAKEAGFAADQDGQLVGTGVNATGLVTGYTSGYTTPADKDGNSVFDFQQAGISPVIGTQPANRSICASSSTTFTVAALDANTYQWQVSTNSGGLWTNLTNTGIYSGVTTATLTLTSVPVSPYNGYWYRVIVSNNSYACTVLTSNIATLVVSGGTPTVPGTISGTTTQCSGLANQIYSIVPVSGATTYSWAVPTGWTITSGQNTTSINVTTGAVGNNGNITVTAGNSCGTSSASSLAVTVNPNLPASVSISASATTICGGTSVTFTATPTKGGTAPTYQWYKGAIALSGETNPTYTSATLANNDQISCGMTSNATPCLTGSPATSNVITIVVTPNNTITLSSAAGTDSQTKCINTAITNITYSTTGATGISNDGVSGANSLPAGVMASWASNQITISGTPTEIGTFNYSISLTGGCGNVNATGTITVNSSTAITSQSTDGQSQCINGTFTDISVTSSETGTLSYQWYSNTVAENTGGSLISGATSASYKPLATTAGTLYYYCVVTGTCGIATSAVSGAFVVNPTLSVSLSVVSSANPICLGNSVTYTATSTNGGSFPVYRWKVNGVNAGANNPSFTYAPANGDVITCELTSDLSCVESATATSNAISMTVVPSPTSLAGSNVSTCASSAVNITAGASAKDYISITWTSSGTGTFTNANSLTLCEYTPSIADVAAGSVVLTLTAKGDGNCADAISSKTLTFHPMPAIFNLNGGGFYCSGGSGVSVGLSGSETGVNYQLFRDGMAIGSTVSGTSSAISFGDQTAGTYTVKATNSTTSCTQDMAGTVAVTDDDQIAPVVTQCLPGETISCVSEIPAGKTSYQGFNEAGGEVTENCTALSSLTVTFADVISHDGECKVTRTYIIKDASGNPATCTQIFTVDDTKAPVINSVVDIQSAPNDNSCGANLYIAAPTSITENCSLVNEGANYQYTIAGIPHSGHGSFTALFPEGITAITWTVTDVCGHVSAPIIQTVKVGINLTSISYDNGSTETASGSGIQPMQTSTHEYFVDNKSPEIGYSYTWELFEADGVTAVSSSLYTKNNVNAAHIKISYNTISTGNYIISVKKTRDGSTCQKQMTLPIKVQSNSSFDVILDNLGNQCQAPSEGLTTISWNVTFPSVITEPFMFSYSIKLGGIVVATGNVLNITYAGGIPTPGLSAGVQAGKSANSPVVVLNYSLYGVSGNDLARTVEIEISATDIYQVSEPNTTNNKDDLKINQVPVINFE